MSLDITVYSCIVKLVKEEDHPQLFSLYFIQEPETNPDPVYAGNKIRVFLSAEQADSLRDQLSMAIEPLIDDTAVFETLPTQQP